MALFFLLPQVGALALVARRTAAILATEFGQRPLSPLPPLAGLATQLPLPTPPKRLKPLLDHLPGLSTSD